MLNEWDRSTGIGSWSHAGYSGNRCNVLILKLQIFGKKQCVGFLRTLMMVGFIFVVLF